MNVVTENQIVFANMIGGNVKFSARSIGLAKLNSFHSDVTSYFQAMFQFHLDYLDFREQVGIETITDRQNWFLFGIYVSSLFSLKSNSKS